MHWEDSVANRSGCNHYKSQILDIPPGHVLANPSAIVSAIPCNPKGFTMSPAIPTPHPTGRISKRRLLSTLSRAIPALLLGGALPSTARANHHRQLTILETRIAGFAYYQGPSLLPRIKPGETLTLQREPSNPYDAKAIEVYWQQQKIGYVPRRNNSALSRLMDDKESISAIVTMTIADERWEPLVFDVMLRA